MLEANTFRSMMLVGGVVTAALLITLIFTAPVVDVDEASRTNYENVMKADLDGADHLTGYQAVMFSIKGKTRGATDHY